uniref:MPN domain-containing protein n=1 Tax=Capitella teleta TaxID=283909 RepID=X1Z8H4_CAPTE
MAEYNVSSRAYCKMVLHAAKYPHCAVNGVLLAEKRQSGEMKTIDLIDAIPLFHLSLSLAPMMEVALIQIEEYCKKADLVIAGYYHANELHEESSPKIIAKRIASKIHENSSGVIDACLLMIDNSRISVNATEEFYDIYLYNNSEWKLKETKDTLMEGALEAAASLLHSKAQSDLTDFDNHLDNITLDWTNPAINEIIDHSA